MQLNANWKLYLASYLCTTTADMIKIRCAELMNIGIKWGGGFERKSLVIIFENIKFYFHVFVWKFN